MGERLGGSGRGGWEMRHVLLACEMLLDGQNYLVGASAHMIPGAVGQHQCLLIPLRISPVSSQQPLNLWCCNVPANQNCASKYIAKSLLSLR